jgi:large conductance mechanosensitive channel
MLTGFKTFIMRGNVIDLAVAFVLGVAFAAVVDAIVNGVINPLIAAVFGEIALADVGVVTVNNAEFYFGAVLGAIINFLAVAAAVYFLVVLPMNKLAERRKAGLEPEPEAPAEDVLLLQEIRDLLAKR